MIGLCFAHKNFDMDIRLDGQHVLVTGASRGIGRAIAEQLYESGATLSLTYRQHKSDAEALTAGWSPDRYRWYAVDFSAPDRAYDLVAQAIAKHGPIHTVVNNAGVASSVSIDASQDEWLEGWHHTFAVNVHALAAITHAVLPHFQGQQQGRFINISSRAAFRGDTPDYMAYAASKGAVVALTRSLARGFGKQGIKAFTIAPGFTRTEMAQDFIETYGEDYVTRDLALSKMTTPQDIAPLITLLASGLADHATGGTFDINAGRYVH